ncbi:MAG: hypothetical protein DHS20C02_03360 [Micavibrio sp.]|nr:MAG: hypothetical protein DHS20C02_03360 [Micavibrio sp.]
MTNQEQWKDANMEEITSINVPFERQDLDVVLRTLSAMSENWHDPRIIDQAAIMLSLDDIKNMIEKLKTQFDLGKDPILVPMDFSDWATYTNLIRSTDNSLPGLENNDFNVLEKLHSQNIKWDEKGLTPTSSL